jgi:hypothetical protein
MSGRRGNTDAERSDSEDQPNMVLLWEESRYSGKAVTKDRPDEANFHQVAPQSESEFV